MAPAAGAAAVMGVVSGGVLGGALHAIAGKKKNKFMNDFIIICWSERRNTGIYTK